MVTRSQLRRIALDQSIPRHFDSMMTDVGAPVTQL
jgi:hypothetical protein